MAKMCDFEVNVLDIKTNKNNLMFYILTTIYLPSSLTPCNAVIISLSSVTYPVIHVSVGISRFKGPYFSKKYYCIIVLLIEIKNCKCGHHVKLRVALIRCPITARSNLTHTTYTTLRFRLC